MKSKIKMISLILLSLLYPYLLTDLVLDETAPWKPVFSNTSFFGNNWVSLTILIFLFTVILYLDRSFSEEKKDESNIILKFIYTHVISLSILAFTLVFSIFMLILVIGSAYVYTFILFMLFFPILLMLFHYFYTIQQKKETYSFNFNLLYLFHGVIIPVILYGLLSSAVI